VSFASVRLTHASVRATVRSISGDALVVQNGTQAMTVRVTAETVIAQGSHTIGLQDLVVGDDVTADGYQLGTDTLLGRKVLVHRKLVGVDGMISSLTADGFSLATASGDIRVIVGTATVVVGSPAAGATVHVTGYRRGDGSILATRVRVTAALRAATVFPLYAGHSDARRNAAQTRRSSP
jgi:RNase P/RNase MRP subunit p29